ncbi:unnamed protein product [Clonostachys chloroleuca]|uniref:Uncharacterized protein n=1 Tax=Clonostachys chloroleuca TaxID=1926264 RepID=A0AA35M6L2_9HYPO|nr:unnamed protein product [Clonostachys chloroleuca]
MMIGGGLWLLFPVEGITVGPAPDSAWLKFDSQAVAPVGTIVAPFRDETWIVLSSESAGGVIVLIVSSICLAIEAIIWSFFGITLLLGYVTGFSVFAINSRTRANFGVSSISDISRAAGTSAAWLHYNIRQDG